VGEFARHVLPGPLARHGTGAAAVADEGRDAVDALDRVRGGARAGGDGGGQVGHADVPSAVAEDQGGPGAGRHRAPLAVVGAESGDGALDAGGVGGDEEAAVDGDQRVQRGGDRGGGLSPGDVAVVGALDGAFEPAGVDHRDMDVLAVGRLLDVVAGPGDGGVE